MHLREEKEGKELLHDYHGAIGRVLMRLLLLREKIYDGTLYNGGDPLGWSVLRFCQSFQCHIMLNNMCRIRASSARPHYYLQIARQKNK